MEYVMGVSDVSYIYIYILLNYIAYTYTMPGWDISWAKNEHLARNTPVDFMLQSKRQWKIERAMSERVNQLRQLTDPC